MYDRIPCLCDDVRPALRIVQPMQLAPPFHVSATPLALLPGLLFARLVRTPHSPITLQLSVLPRNVFFFTLNCFE